MTNEKVEQGAADGHSELAALRSRIYQREGRLGSLKPMPVLPYRRSFSKGLVFGLVPFIGLVLLIGSALYGQDTGEALFIDQSGRVGIGGDLNVTGRVGVGTDLNAFGTIVAKSFEGIGAVPKGAILMWSGNPAQLPAGWVLCDGRPGTPDLRGRFVVGYNPGDREYNTVKAVGGEAAHVLSPAEMGNHTHQVARGGSGVGTHSHRWAGSSTTDARANVAVYGPSTAGAVQNTGATGHENRPPYMVLAYIMYIGEIKK
jgi:microcystin-dependent protein